MESPRCYQCGLEPSQIEEYVEQAEEADYGSPDEFVRHEEGTFNSEHNTFCCTSCYIKMGCPSFPTGWKAP